MKPNKQLQDLQVIYEAASKRRCLCMETPSCQRLYENTSNGNRCYVRTIENDVRLSKCRPLKRRLFQGLKKSVYEVYGLLDEDKRCWAYVLVDEITKEELWFIHSKLTR